MKPLIVGTVKSKTVYIGLAVIVMGYTQNHLDAIKAFVPADWIGLIDYVLGAAVIVCRFFTSESLADKGTTTNENA